MKKTAIIILNYNNPSDTVACLRSVKRYNTAPVKYVVVDNGSTDGISVSEIDGFLAEAFEGDYMRVREGDSVPSSLPQAVFMTSRSNDGYARGNNKGIALAANDDEIDRLLILNNDILYIEDIIPPLKEAQDSLPDCGIISPLLLTGKGADIDWNCARNDTRIGSWIKNNFLAPYYWLCKKSVYEIYRESLLLYKKEEPYPQFMPIELPSGSCMLVKKDVFAAIGNFDPATFLYYEENILYRKLLKLNLRNYIATRLRCIHLGAATMVKSPSRIVAEAAKASRSYYIRTYLAPSWEQRILLRVSDAWLQGFVFLKSIVKK